MKQDGLGSNGLSALSYAMAHLLFTCPRTLEKVQHWMDESDDAAGDRYEPIPCLACTRLHFINRKTGKLLGEIE